MGSLDRYCRLCAMMARTDQLVKLFGDQRDNELLMKLTSFLSFNVSPIDRLPKQVCVSCVSNIDFCIQFVDKCRKIEQQLQTGADIEFVQWHSNYRYSNKGSYEGTPGTLKTKFQKSTLFIKQISLFFSHARSLYRCFLRPNGGLTDRATP